MNDRSTFKLRVEGLGSRAEVAWPKLRDIFDAYINALAAMPDGPRPAEVALVGVGEGSTNPVYQAPRRTKRAVHILAIGPTREWTHQQRRGAEPLYALVRRHGASLCGGLRRMEPIIIPPAAMPDRRVREATLLRGRIITVGFSDLHAQVEFSGFGQASCTGDRAVMMQAARYLHEDVMIAGSALWDLETGDLLGFEATGIQSAPIKLRASEALAEIDELVAGALDGVSMRELLSRGAS